MSPLVAKDIMSSPVVTAPTGTTLRDAARTLVAHRISGLPVVDTEGRLVGILTSTDFQPREGQVPHSDVRAIQVFGRWLGTDGLDGAYAEAHAIQVEDVMKRDPLTVGEDTPLDEVAQLMLTHQVNHIPVLRDAMLVGIVTAHDFVRLSAQR